MKRIKRGLCFVMMILVCVGMVSCNSSREEPLKISFVLEPDMTSEVGGDDGQTRDVWKLQERLEGDNNVILSGYKADNEYPYGYNVGEIEDEVVGEAILITPGTSISVADSFETPSFLCFDYFLHPWVAEKSDGAILNITIEGNEITDSYTFNAENTQQNGVISLEKYLGDELHIVFSVQNEPGGNEECDWLILKNVIVDNVARTVKTVFSDSGYVRSATYFGDEWPVNFWNTELDNLDQDFRQIRTDGFDSIILVIPWREFQPEMEPVAYNKYAFENLDRIMQAAERNDLMVYARIGYSWDYYHDGEEYVLDRFCQLLGRDSVKKAWFSYVETMYKTLSAYSCFGEAFLTWEDFWYTLNICDEENEKARQEKAALIGYQTWVEDNFSLSEYNEAFGTDYKSFTAIPVPQRTEPAMKAMYTFYDDFLKGLLESSQQFFPNLSMEVRMDWDMVYNLSGEMESYKHTKTFECGISNYTATMYGIPMGFENVGERVDYQEAMAKTEYILKQLKQQNGNKSVYIEQFIFADNTPGFEHNAQIKEEDLNVYLENVASVLHDNSEGYGIWTYRNYCVNMLYNPQFALEDAGWELSGEVSFEKIDGSMTCILKQNAGISQAVYNTRNSSDADEYLISFYIADVKQAGELVVSFGENEQKISVSEKGKVNLSFPRTDSFDVTIRTNDCVVGIDNIKLYAHVQQGFLYDENNNELQCIEGIRSLNEQLSK